MTVLVTGATGGLGNMVLNHLKNIIPQKEIYGLARNNDKSQKLLKSGFNVKIATYDDPTLLEQAFEGVNRLLLISSSEIDHRQEQHKNVIDAAQKAGVSYIAYTSFAKATKANSPLSEDHAYTENLILNTGIDHTFLRNNWYLENEKTLLDTALITGKVVHAGGNGQAGWQLRREFAEVAARAISGQFSFPNVLEVGGSLITYQQLFEALERVSGKKIEIISSDNNAASKYLQDFADLPKEVANIYVSSQEIIRSGDLAVQADNMTKYLGRPLISTDDALKELLHLT